MLPLKYAARVLEYLVALATTSFTHRWYGNVEQSSFSATAVQHLSLFQSLQMDRPFEVALYRLRKILFYSYKLNFYAYSNEKHV
jgi:hypothetical protein